MYNPQLETFICVVEAGSFSKAADRLFISPPAVIKQINSLEASLGLQLFSRTHRGLVVTEAGCKIYYRILQGVGKKGKGGNADIRRCDTRGNIAAHSATGVR